MRRCSRAACGLEATSTLTYAYTDSTAVLGPLALRAEPHGYDLCATHASALSVPRGWEVIRLVSDEPAPGPSTDDLVALADAVREVGFTYDLPAEDASSRARPYRADRERAGIVEIARKGHLSVLADPG